MDILSIVGWLLGFGMIVFGIIFNADTGKIVVENFDSFVDVPSIAIVIGGTIGALMVSFPLKAFAKVPKHLKIVFLPKKYDAMKIIAELVEFAREARINGLLALEDKLANTKDEFMKSSLMLVVDSVDPEKVKQLLETELDYLDDRHSQDLEFYNRGTSLAPAFGMIGTLIGLILLLKDMSDPDALAQSMAVALITTLYGSIMSNLIFAPISTKLKARHNEEYLCKLIISEGVQAIQAGENPRFIEEKLTQLLPLSVVKKKGKGKAADSGAAEADAGGGKK